MKIQLVPKPNGRGVELGPVVELRVSVINK